MIKHILLDAISANTFNFDVVDILRIGVIGLGFLLALLAYKLLSNKGNKQEPRQSIINATYVFMVFSIACLGIGLLSKVFKEKNPIEVVDIKLLVAKNKITKNLITYKPAGFNNIRR
jgi:hypothetical protein